MNTGKKEVAKTVAMPKQADPKTATTAKAEEKKLSITEMLEKQLSEIKRKKQLADRRDIFIAKCEEVDDCLTMLQEEHQAGTFATDNFTLIFARKNGYSDKETFRISNPAMIVKFLSVLQGEMLQTVKKIETELLRDL